MKRKIANYRDGTWCRSPILVGPALIVVLLIFGASGAAAAAAAPDRKAGKVSSDVAPAAKAALKPMEKPAKHPAVETLPRREGESRLVTVGS